MTRITTRSEFGPSLEWEELPLLVQRKHRYRARAWRLILLGLALFWGGVIAAVVSWIG